MLFSLHNRGLTTMRTFFTCSLNWELSREHGVRPLPPRLPANFLYPVGQHTFAFCIKCVIAVISSTKHMLIVIPLLICLSVIFSHIIETWIRWNFSPISREGVETEPYKSRTSDDTWKTSNKLHSITNSACKHFPEILERGVWLIYAYRIPFE